MNQVFFFLLHFNKWGLPNRHYYKICKSVITVLEGFFENNLYNQQIQCFQNIILFETSVLINPPPYSPNLFCFFLKTKMKPHWKFWCFKKNQLLCFVYPLIKKIVIWIPQSWSQQLFGCFCMSWSVLSRSLRAYDYRVHDMEIDISYLCGQGQGHRRDILSKALTLHLPILYWSTSLALYSVPAKIIFSLKAKTS